MFISIKQIIDRLGVSRGTLSNMRRRGDFIPSHRISERRVGFLATDFDAWLASRAAK